MYTYIRNRLIEYKAAEGITLKELAAKLNYRSISHLSDFLNDKSNEQKHSEILINSVCCLLDIKTSEILKNLERESVNYLLCEKVKNLECELSKFAQKVIYIKKFICDRNKMMYVELLQSAGEL